MTTERVSQHEPAWPQPNEQQMLQVVEHRCRDLYGPVQRRAGWPATVPVGITGAWRSCAAISRGWNAHWEVWRLSGSERRGGCAPVQVRDHAISTRMERAATPLHWLCEQVSAWRRTDPSGSPFEDRRLALWATAVSAADASTLDHMSRLLPWLRTLAEGEARLPAGQFSAVCDMRVQQWVRVDGWSHARDHDTAHGLTLIEHLHAGSVLLCDRGSLRVAFCDRLPIRGIWWIRRYAHQVSAQVSPLCSHADGVLDAIVDLGTASSKQAHDPVRDPHALTRSNVVNVEARS
jgi:hypothetical protein